MTEELIAFVRVLAEDKRLRDWLAGLDGLPENLRLTQIGQMAARMGRQGENDELIELIKRLSDRTVFDAVVKTLNEMDV